jgi:hypothetical protein
MTFAFEIGYTYDQLGARVIFYAPSGADSESLAVTAAFNRRCVRIQARGGLHTTSGHNVRSGADVRHYSVGPSLLVVKSYRQGHWRETSHLILGPRRLHSWENSR